MAADLLAVGDEAMPITGTLVASGAYQAADPSAAEFCPRGATGMTVTTSVTVISGAGATLTVHVEGYDKASGTWVTLLTSAGYVATGAVVITIDPRIVAATNVVAQKGLMERMRVRPVKSGTTTTLTYSIGASLYL